MILFETDRLIVQRFRPSDEEYFFKINGSPEVMHFIRPAKTREESNVFFRENLNFYLDHSVLGRYAVFTKTEGKFIGTFSYLYLSGEADFHIGYALLPEAWNMGFASELVRFGVPCFFEKTAYPSLYAIITAANIASQKVLEKNGFRYKGPSQESGSPTELYYINRNLGPEAVDK